MPFDKAPAERLPSFFQGNDTVDEKKMSGGLAFMVNGYMCCGMVGKDLAVRTGPDAFDESVRPPHSRPMDLTGRPMKGFFFVAPAGFQSDLALKSWAQRGLDFVLSSTTKVNYKSGFGRMKGRTSSEQFVRPTES